ncbi:MAG: aminotransferase [Alphaproteobacteria bacterium HGW-Alphaproteobacteria-13]|nr:MAG: aminotransferase [Alphaproteobacteria bacterium HGW-Alphaproteobacteria-13]
MSRDIEAFRAIEISHLARQLSARGRSVIHMEFGQPSDGAPAGAVAAARAALDEPDMGYWESVPLRKRIARHYAEDYGVEVDAQRILLTCGASPALVLALLTAFAAGSRVMTARPGYVAYRNSLRALQMIPVEVECGAADRFQISARAIREADPKPDGLIVASPANPTGTIIPPAELAEIAEVCRVRGIRIISDEIYHRLSYGAETHSILQYDPDAFVINSFSKYYGMPGWRLGWIVCPQALVADVRARAGNLFLSPPSLSQQAALAAFDCEEELDARVAMYRRNRERLIACLAKLGITDIAPSDGAFYIYASIAHLTDDSLSFCKRLLEDTGVATAPGLDFDPDRGGRFIRFSYAVTTDMAREACTRIEAWFRDNFPNAG